MFVQAEDTNLGKVFDTKQQSNQNYISVIEGIERKVEEFAASCLRFSEAVTKRLPAQIDSLAQRQRRRVKPTLISSFGLFDGSLDSKDTSCEGHLFDKRRTREKARAASEEQVKKSGKSGEFRQKLYTAWEELKRHFPDTVNEPQETVSWLACSGLIALAKSLRASQTMLECDAEVGLVILKESPELMQMLAILLDVLEKNAKVLLYLVPSQMEIFECNHLFRQILNAEKSSIRNSLDMARQSLLTQESIGHVNDRESDLDAVPLPYSDRRDSRNYADHQLLYANQQKLRDQLLDWIRRLNVLPDPQRAAIDIMRMVHRENYEWFSQLLLYEFEQLNRGMVTCGNGPSRDPKSRLERLEERLTNKKKTPVNGENPVILFLECVDSFKLVTALQMIVFNTIETLQRPLVDGSNRQEPRWSSEVLRLASLGRLLAACSSNNINRYEDPTLCFAREALLEAHSKRHLLAVLPWVLTWMRDCSTHKMGISGIILSLRKYFGRKLVATIDNYTSLERLKVIESEEEAKASPIKKCEYDDSDLLADMVNFRTKLGKLHTQDPLPNLVAIILLLEGIPISESQVPTEISEGESAFANDTNVFGKSLDDYQGILGLEGVLSNLLPDFRRFVVELSQANNPLNSMTSFNDPLMLQSHQATMIDSSLKTLKVPRKVRPTTESTDGVIQRKLRQWFWWQHPALKEFCDALSKYLATDATFSCHEKPKLLWKIIPPLLPPSLADTPKIIELVICLVLEMSRDQAQFYS